MEKVVISHRIVEEGLQPLEGRCRVVLPPEGGFDEAALIGELADALSGICCA